MMPTTSLLLLVLQTSIAVVLGRIWLVAERSAKSVAELETKMAQVYMPRGEYIAERDLIRTRIHDLSNQVAEFRALERLRSMGESTKRFFTDGPEK